MSSDGSDLRQRYAEALRTAAKDAIVGEASAPSKMLDAVMAVRDEELERVRARATNFYDAIGRAVAERDEWRERAETAEHVLSLLTAEAPPVPDGTGDDTARHGWAERTVDQWRKYAAHWRAHAETAGRRLSLTRDRLDALIAAGFGATTDTLRELRAALDSQSPTRETIAADPTSRHTPDSH